jgi:hypothetical protein
MARNPAPDAPFGKPRVVDPDRTPKWREYSPQCAAEIAEADNAYTCAGEEEVAGVAGKAPLLRACPKRFVRLRYAPREIDRHPKCSLGDGSRVNGTGIEYMDSPLEAVRVVNIGQQIAFDIEDGAENWHSVQSHCR